MQKYKHMYIVFLRIEKSEKFKQTSWSQNP